MRELDSISDFMDMNLSKLQEMMKDSEFWNTTVHETTKGRTQLSDWTATIIEVMESDNWIWILKIQRKYSNYIHL